MSFLKRASKSIINALEIAGRAKTLQHLENLSDRTLEDLGFSRTLMSQGVSAWPWKATQEVSYAKTQTASEAINAAVEELNAYNDRDLADLGIARGEIKEAVVKGRKDIDQANAA